MCADEFDRENFEDTVRSIAREISESVERLAGQVDVDELAGYVGVDAERAREWVQSAATWFGGQLENLGDEFAARAQRPSQPKEPRSSDEDPLRGAAPHPLDLPTDEQGQALAALESGRWAVEPGTQRLTARGEGPSPSDTLGLVRELRSRDWIAADGEVTSAGRRALGRWLDSAQST